MSLSLDLWGETKSCCRGVAKAQEGHFTEWECWAKTHFPDIFIHKKPIIQGRSSSLVFCCKTCNEDKTPGRVQWAYYSGNTLPYLPAGRRYREINANGAHFMLCVCCFAFKSLGQHAGERALLLALLCSQQGMEAAAHPRLLKPRRRRLIHHTSWDQYFWFGDDQS